MINVDTYFFLEARHVDFMTTIKERLWFAKTTNHDAFQTVYNVKATFSDLFLGGGGLIRGELSY